MKTLFARHKKFQLNKLDKVYLFSITIMGILARITFILNVPCNPVSDFKKYQIIATNIFIGNGHSYLGKPTAFQPMGYPYTLGYFYKLMGSNNIFLGKILNLLLSSITLIIILLILLKLCKNILSVHIAYTIITFIPNYIAYNNVLGSEILITFLLSVIIYLQLCNFNVIIRYITMGIFIGFAALTKPFFLVYTIMISLIYWLKNKNKKETFKLFFITTIFMLIVVAPWTYRNYKKFNLIIPVSHNGGYVLFINNNSNNKNGAWMSVENINVSNDLKKDFYTHNFSYGDKSKNEIDQIMLNPSLDNLFKKEAKKWIWNHPLRFCQLGLLRLRNTFFHGAGDIYQWTMASNQTTKYSTFLKTKFINTIFNGYVHILNFFGFIFVIYNIKKILVGLFKKGTKIDYVTSIPFFNIAFFILIAFVFEGQQRYNFPILFLCSLCIVSFIEKLNVGDSTLAHKFQALH
ncbi:glycosyltransferase family 39 protein [Clostridium sp. KNHs214]|uniref:glycosyltransferase family 39 protein n=1 Tax=Clostridium sp. KNHs214 TaxID=1540257 RepID=UPI00068DC3DC|nr:glycosyltransferase family 39 protein [Clostridium sp. KNHs214]